MPRGHGDLSMWGIPLYDKIQRARVMSQPVERYGVLASLLHEMHRRKARYALECICGGGGLGIAAIFERT